MNKLQFEEINSISPTKGNGISQVSINNYLFFACIFIFQVLVTLQGLDLLDEGFHVAFYQQFFNSPQSVQYAFVYWFSGFIGGGIMKLFPLSGLLGIRLAGAIASTLTVFLAYTILKKQLNNTVLKLSLIILVLFISNDPKTLYYNNLSSLIYVLIAYFLCKGLIDKKYLFIFAAGFFVGLNIFTRLPNILGIAIGSVIFFHGIIYHDNLKTQLKNILIYTLGLISSICIIILLMRYIGHLPIFLNSVKAIFKVSHTATKNDGTEGSYGMASLISLCGMQYFISVISVIILAFLILCWAYFMPRINSLPKILSWICKLCIILPAAAFIILIIRNGINNYKLIYFITGLSIIASLCVLVFDKNRERKIIAFIGCFIMMIHPFGSAVGIFTVVPYSLWLSFPFVISYFFNIESLDIHFNWKNKNGISNFIINLDKKFLKGIKIGILGVIIITSLYQVIKYPYFYDTHNRLYMKYEVHNKFMRGIYVSEKKADVINELLHESAKYIKPNDYVLAYDLIPMYHYWTETKSYVRNPCPWFYSGTMFRDELNLAEADTKMPLPVVVMQTIKTVGFDNSRWPEVVPGDDYANWDRNKGRNQILSDFLLRHNYKTVWGNSVFKILIPG